MLAKKVSHGRLRDKPSQKNNKKTSENDKMFLEWASNQDMPCIICHTMESIELHHIKRYSSDVKDHKKLIPLCSDHHKYNMDISAHANKKAFEELFPIENQEIIAKGIYFQFLEEMGSFLG